VNGKMTMTYEKENGEESVLGRVCHTEHVPTSEDPLVGSN